METIELLKTILGILAVYTVARELFFHYTVQKLLNKAMSRSFHEYKVADLMHSKSNDGLRKEFQVEADELETLNSLMR